MDMRRFSDADHHALAEARLPLRTEPASVYTNPDVEYGPIDERIIAFIVDVFNRLLDANDYYDIEYRVVRHVGQARRQPMARRHVSRGSLTNSSPWHLVLFHSSAKASRITWVPQ